MDTETSRFQGSPLARGQEMNKETHPHLELDPTMVSLPKVDPGDSAWWHCSQYLSSLDRSKVEFLDVIHAVESAHHGKGPSAVMYIPSAL